MRPVIIVMAKTPRAGFVKTRLVPSLSAIEASALAACFMQDTVATALGVVPELILAYAPHDGRALLETLLPDGLLWLEQRGENLGERLDGAVAHAARLGFSPILVIGTDSPTLSPSFIETARDALVAGEADAALGPTTDGGYYLVGLRVRARGLFQNISWSTPLAYEQTASNIKGLGLRLLKLPLWYDVDTTADLFRLRAELSADEKARERARATYRWLCSHA
jgi:rSAM/selenodomain-associated transferase 1